MASPTFKAAGTPNNASATSVALALPSVTNDDYAIAMVYVEPAGTTISPPAGWTTVGTQIDSTNFSMFHFVRRLLSSDTGVTFNSTGATFMAGGTVVYSGVQTTSTALDAINIFSSGLTGTSTAAQGNGMTVTVSDTVIVYTEFNFGGALATPPSGMTERVDNTIYVADLAFPTAGATGAKTATLASSEEWATRNFALKSDTSTTGGTVLTVDSATLLISGQDVAMQAGGSVTIPVTNTSLGLTASSVNFSVETPWTEAALTLTGSDITLTAQLSITLPVTEAALTLTGSDISLVAIQNIPLVVTNADLTLTGQDVTFLIGGGSPVVITVDTSTLTLTGSNVDISASFTIPSGTGGSARRKRYRGIRRLLNHNGR
jgi:hypothetical protein